MLKEKWPLELSVDNQKESGMAVEFLVKGLLACVEPRFNCK